MVILRRSFEMKLLHVVLLSFLSVNIFAKSISSHEEVTTVLFLMAGLYLKTPLQWRDWNKEDSVPSSSVNFGKLQEKIFQCYFQSDYLHYTLAKVIVLKSSQSCPMVNHNYIALSHLRNSGIEGLIPQGQANCFEVDLNKTINGLTNNTIKIIEIIKQLQTSPPASQYVKAQTSWSPFESDDIEQTGWFLGKGTPECTYVYAIDREPVGINGSFNGGQQISNNTVFFILALSSLVYFFL